VVTSSHVIHPNPSIRGAKDGVLVPKINRVFHACTYYPTRFNDNRRPLNWGMMEGHSMNNSNSNHRCINEPDGILIIKASYRKHWFWACISLELALPVFLLESRGPGHHTHGSIVTLSTPVFVLHTDSIMLSSLHVFRKE
jgi:hypothetical protein